MNDSAAMLAGAISARLEALQRMLDLGQARFELALERQAAALFDRFVSMIGFIIPILALSSDEQSEVSNLCGEPCVFLLKEEAEELR